MFETNMLEMNAQVIVAVISMAAAAFAVGVASIGNALGQGRAVGDAVLAIAQQPDAANTISRTLFVGVAMVETTAIYAFVTALILLFANPFWNCFSSGF